MSCVIIIATWLQSYPEGGEGPDDAAGVMISDRTALFAEEVVSFEK